LVAATLLLHHALRHCHPSGCEAEALKQRLDALVVGAKTGEEKAAATRHYILAVCQLLNEEQVITADLERQVATTKKLVPESVSSSTMETTTNSSLHESTLVANLHIQADAVPNIRSLMNIALDTTPSNYARWHENMLLTLTRYILVDHIQSNDAFSDDLG
jgi:hypothetical protein